MLLARCAFRVFLAVALFLLGPVGLAVAEERGEKPWDTAQVLEKMRAGRRAVYMGTQRFEMRHGPRVMKTEARVAQLDGWTRTEFLSPPWMKGMVTLERGRERLVRLPFQKAWIQRTGDEHPRPWLLAKNYRLVETGRTQIAGRNAVIIEIQHRASRTTARKLWLDAETGVALRTELCDWTGKVVGTIEMQEIDYRPRLEKSDFVVSPDDIVRRPPVLAPPNAEKMPLHPAFLPEGYVPAGPRRWVRMEYGIAAHLPYTDGLKALSVFVRRLHPGEKPLPPRRGPRRDEHAPPFSRAARVTKGDYRITVIGDLPHDVLRRVAESVE